MSRGLLDFWERYCSRNSLLDPTLFTLCRVRSSFPRGLVKFLLSILRALICILLLLSYSSLTPVSSPIPTFPLSTAPSLAIPPWVALPQLSVPQRLFLFLFLFSNSIRHANNLRRPNTRLQTSFTSAFISVVSAPVDIPSLAVRGLDHGRMTTACGVDILIVTSTFRVARYCYRWLWVGSDDWSRLSCSWLGIHFNGESCCGIIRCGLEDGLMGRISLVIWGIILEALFW